MSIRAKLTFALEVQERLDSPEAKSGPIIHTLPAAGSQILTMADGTDNDEVDLFFSDERTLGASANEVLDVVGSLSDTFGNTISAAEIMGLVFIVTTASGSIDVGPDATAGFVGPFGDASDRMECGYLYGLPGLWIGSAAGWACAGGSTDEIYVVNNSGSASVTYRVGILARSA